MKRMLALIGFLFLMAATIARPAVVQAAGSWFNPTGQEMQSIWESTERSGGMNAESAGFLSTATAMWVLPATIVGFSDDPASSGYYGRSGIAMIERAAVEMYQQPPANLALWVNNTAQTLGFVPNRVYAQGRGVGFTGLTALLPIWGAFRNIAYVVLAFVMLVIGFMVMLRKKIDPQTVITVQNALPRIVLTLILITFSYAIVGALIDLMYLVILVVVSVLAPLGGGVFGDDTAARFINSGFMEVWGRMFGGGFRSFDDLLRFLNPAVVQWLDTVGETPGELAAGGFQLILSFFEVPIIALILSLILLFAVIRIFFMLVSAYINIIVALIFAPLQILMEAFPGGTGFSSWLRNLVANIAVFPITIALLMVAIVLNRATSTGASVDVTGVPFPIPSTGGAGRIWSPPLLYPGGQYGLGGIIGLGMLMGIPTIVNSVKEALKAKPMVPAGAGVILGPIGGAVGTGMQGMYQLSFISHSFQGLGGILGLGGSGHGGKKH